MSIYLSASSISDFIKCPQKVLYRRTKQVEQVPSREMVLGNIAHAAIEKGWSDRNRAIEVVNYWVKNESLPRKDRDDLLFYVDIFFLNFKHLLSDKDTIEYNFKLQLYDDVFIVGKMDRISNGNIFDWKTGKVPTRVSNDVQCIIYDYSYEKLFGKQANSICLASLSSGELVPYTRNDFYVKEIFDNIIPRMIKTIKNESYERLGMFNHSCFRCPYKIGCLSGIKGEYDNVLDNTVSPE